MSASVRIFDLEVAHVISRPQLPGFEIVGGHARAILELRSQFVEQVRVHADSGGYGEVAGGRLSFEILILNAPERNAADGSIDGGLGGGAKVERNSEVVAPARGTSILWKWPLTACPQSAAS